MDILNSDSVPYKALCTEYYDLDKPQAPEDVLRCYLKYAAEAHGPILEPMCGTGRFLVPLLKQGYEVIGFDSSAHMLEVCRKKLRCNNLTGVVVEASFETFSFPGIYNLIIIPSGSFCLLTNETQVNEALSFISNHLQSNGKFIFEIDTLSAVQEAQLGWRGNWVQRPNGSKIVLSTLSHFNKISRIETTLCRYELWEKNSISCTEVEDFRLKLYDPSEIEALLKKHGLKVLGKWQADPYLAREPGGNASTILYECNKDNSF